MRHAMAVVVQHGGDTGDAVQQATVDGGFPFENKFNVMSAKDSHLRCCYKLINKILYGL